MNQRLTVQVDADIKNLERGLQRGAKSVDKFGSEITKGEKQVGKFGKTTQVNAVPAMTSFSQVIQDAPYGIRGVANNITQLTSQMGYLAKSSGGAMAALRAMGGAMLGPAGILFAVSTITSLLVSYGDKLEFATSQTEKLAEATKKYVGEAMAEISQLKILIGIASNVANSTDVRRAAIEKINGKYSKYLGNLDLERLKTTQVKNAIDGLTKSLITQAKIKGLQDMITEKTSESATESVQLDLEKAKSVKTLQSEMKKLKNSNDFWGRIIRQGKDLNEQIALLKKAAPGLDFPELTGVKSALGNYNELNNKIQEVEESTNKALEPLVKLQSKFEKDVLGFEVTPTFSQDEIMIEGGGEKPEVKVKGKIDEIIVSEDPFAGNYAMEGTAKGLFGNENDINGFQQYLRDLENIEEKLEDTTVAAEEFGSLTIQQAAMVSSAFAEMGSQLADSLLDGEFSLEKFAKMMIKTAAKILTGLLAQSIGNAIVSGSQTAAASGPAAAFLLPGLVAGSVGVVQGAFSSMPSFNDGGIVGGGMATGDKVLARLNSGEMVLNQSQQGNLFRALNGSHLGQSAPLEIVGESRISGDTIITAYKRAESRNNRIG